MQRLACQLLRFHPMTRTSPVWPLPTLLALGVLSFSEPARADSGLTLAAEGGPQIMLNDVNRHDFPRWGFAAAGRAGYTFDLPFLDITPEAKLGIQAPGDTRSFSGMGGVRLNVGALVSPAIFAHVGGIVGDIDGFVWDAGVGLDFTMIPVVDLGIFVAYTQVGDAHFSGHRASYESGTWHWLQFGAQVALHL